MATDYYELLGVSRDATTDEMKRSYRKLARQLHPDANPDDPEAEARFKEVSHAYSVLSDEQQRAKYDRYGPEGLSGGGGGDPFSNVGDIFEAFFGGGSPFGGGGRQRGPAGPPRGADQEVIADVSFVDAVFGAEAPVSFRSAVVCDACDGDGTATGTSPSPCSTCDGIGQVRQVRQSILGQMVTSGPCPTCAGAGEVITDPCSTCRGEGRRLEEQKFEVRVPAGVDTGSTLRLTGRGAAGPRGGPPGDLYVHIRVAPHERFVRDGDDLLDDLHISVAQAALGVKIDYETLDGTEEIGVPPGTQPGEVFKLRGKGVPRLQSRQRGDILLRVVVDVPTKLKGEQEDLLRRFAELRSEPVADADEGGLFAKIRSAFH